MLERWKTVWWMGQWKRTKTESKSTPPRQTSLPPLQTNGQWGNQSTKGHGTPFVHSGTTPRCMATARMEWFAWKSINNRLKVVFSSVWLVKKKQRNKTGQIRKIFKLIWCGIESIECGNPFIRNCGHCAYICRFQKENERTRTWIFSKEPALSWMGIKYLKKKQRYNLNSTIRLRKAG